MNDLKISLEIHADRAWRRFDKMIERELKPVENLFRGYFRAELPLVLAAIKQLEVEDVAAELTSWAGIIGEKPNYLWSSSIRSTEKKVKTALENNGRKWTTKIEGVLGKTAVPFAKDLAIQLGFEFPGFPKATKKFIRSYVTKIVDELADSSRHRIMRTVSKGIESGSTLPEIEDDIREVYKSWDRSRPEAIARTETGRVASVVQNDLIDEAGLDVIQIWLTARDARVRELHEELEGEEREMDQEFSEGLKFPRDPNGPAEQTINCRCSRLFRINGD